MSSTSETPSLRVLLIEQDPEVSEQWSRILEGAQHDVLPLSRMDEASEALDLQRFDVVLVPADVRTTDLSALSSQLQRIEARLTPGIHIPIVSCSKPSDEADATRSSELIDAQLTSPLDADRFTRTVMQLTVKVQNAAPAGSSEPLRQLPVFDETEFSEQVCADPELMVEIIDLYLEESQRQIVKLIECERAGRLPELSRVAHTIKGSLSSLHAARARAAAQQLESSAKAELTPESSTALRALLNELSELQPVLTAFRDSQQAS